MNNKRRALLKGAMALLEKASIIVEQALEQEQDCLDNIPENLQTSDKYGNMEMAVDYLGDVAIDLDSAKDKIVEIIA